MRPINSIILCGLCGCLLLPMSMASEQPTRNQQLLDALYDSEHSLIYPGMDLLFVTFVQQYGADVFLEKLELQLDDQLVVRHVYNWEDVAKLMEQAVQQLYTDLITPGSHRLYARLYSRGLNGQDYIDGETTLTKGADPAYVEISIVGGKLNFEVW